MLKNKNKNNMKNMNSKKVLYVATVDSHILHFHIPYLKMLKDMGYEVCVATSGDFKISYSDKKYVIPFSRNPFNLKNIKAFYMLKKIILKERFDIIHTHTPTASVLTRLAAKKARRSGTKVIYTAHGFHFYKGCSVLNWLLYYPLEKYLSRYTDTLITINKEDYDLASKKFHSKNIEFINGVGVDTKKFDIKISEEEKKDLRKELDILSDDFVMLYPAELTKRKNQGMLLVALKYLIKEDKKYKLLLAGDGNRYKYYTKIAKRLGVEENVKFLGYRKDINRLLKISNILVSTAKQEGLPVNVIEAKMASVKVVVTNCRGNKDLIQKEDTDGYVVNINDYKTLVNKIRLLKAELKIKKLEPENYDTRKYSLDTIQEEMKRIYINVSKKTVMHVFKSNIFSGAENVAITIINLINKNKANNIDFVYVSPKGPICKVLEENNIKYEGISKLNIKEIRRVYKKYRPDIIHVHDSYASCITSVSFANTKLISHIHGDPAWLKHINLKTIMYLLSTFRFNKIIFVSSVIRDDFVFSKLIKNKLIILKNPVNIEDIIEKSNIEIDAVNKFDLIFIGRLSEEKNPTLFIELVSEIKKYCKEIKAAIVGDGVLRIVCEAKIKELRLSENIQMLGFLDNPYAPLKNSKVLVLTSISEGYPLVLIEAITLNVPVVTTNVGGVKEIVNNFSGKLCNTKKEMIDEITKLINDESYYNQKKKSILKYSKNIIDNFARTINKIEEMYNN